VNKLTPAAGASAGPAREMYRCGPCNRFPQGPGQELVHFPMAGFNRRMSGLEASAVGQWTGFRTLDEAVDRSVTLTPSLSGTAIRELFVELEERGALISYEQLISSLSSAPTTQRGDIDWLAIPTAGRTECVERAVTSYLHNMEEFGRRCSIFVADDSKAANARSNCDDALTWISAEQRRVISYAGVREKRLFAERLSGGGRIPRDVVDYLLRGSRYSNRNTGANRNAILLQTLGSMVLSVDDDTICIPGRASVAGGDAGLAIAGHGLAEEAWCFAGRYGGLGLTTPEQIDVFGEHEALLGKPLASVTHAAAATGRGVDLDGMCGHLLSSLLCGTGRIAVTTNGAVGDSGFNSDLSLISHRSRETRNRIQALNCSYDAVMQSRGIVRQVPCAAITHVQAFSVGMFLGLDNRGLNDGTLLPPFVPDFENEDGTFGRTAALCCGDAYAGHLPFTLLHEPPVERVYSAGRDVNYRMCDVIGWCMSAAGQLPGISGLGAWLQELAARPSAEMVELLTMMACSHRSGQIEALESLLAEDGYMPAHWADDVSGRIEAMRCASEYDFSKPADLVAADDGVVPALQSVLNSFGCLLEWWPAIIQRTATLASDGIKLGRIL